ncbi:MAG: tetratricopeptide repeat protein, partial [Verrucomicrobia bacterium]|nr:tetratricopeptide repeat protein [Verrucomicrobiota bacterium]
LYVCGWPEQARESMNAIGRNEPCPCGSGKKYKKCCLERDVSQARQNRPVPLPASGEDDFTTELLPKVDEAVDQLLIRLEKGQYENVEADLEALLRKHPDYHTTNYAMGVYQAMVLEDAESAIPFFQKAVSVFPLMAEAHCNLGTCYIKTARVAEAVASLHKAIQYSADDDYIGNKARAELQTLERIALKDSPFRTLDAYIENQRLFDLAFENLQARRHQAAVDLFSQVLVQNPDHVQSHGNIALAYAGLGKKALALEHLDKALALDPTYAPAIQNRMVIELMTEGEPQRPLAMAETEYYREQAEAERDPARPSWWQKIKRLTDFSNTDKTEG